MKAYILKTHSWITLGSETDHNRNFKMVRTDKN